HCSASWSLDEVVSSSTRNPTLTNVTVQWCFITEGLNPDNHGFGSLIRGTGGAKFSYINNLYAHHRRRSPRSGNYDSNPHDKDPEGLLLDFRNNVIYNWDGEYAGYNADSKSVTKLNYVGNYLIPGKNSVNNGIAYATGSPYNQSYFSGNFYDGKQPADQWKLVRFNDSWTSEDIEKYKRNSPFDAGPVSQMDAQTAFQRVLSDGGATLPGRDPVDLRIVSDVKNRTGKIIASQEDVGGWPVLNSAPAPKDSDQDGMPDDWEKKQKLDPNDPEDRNKVNSEGYTLLEQYLNSLK
ncbi:MAG: pectate lyase, partial [Cyclobacteriaceae bacterium]